MRVRPRGGRHQAQDSAGAVSGILEEMPPLNTSHSDVPHSLLPGTFFLNLRTSIRIYIQTKCPHDPSITTRVITFNFSEARSLSTTKRCRANRRRLLSILDPHVKKKNGNILYLDTLSENINLAGMFVLRITFSVLHRLR